MVSGAEKLMVLEKEVLGPRLKADDSFRLYSHRTGGRESVGVPVFAEAPSSGVQTAKHYSYVTVGREWTVVEELFNASNEKTPIEDYKTQLSCVAGDTWKPYVQGIPPKEIVVPADLSLIHI